MFLNFFFNKGSLNIFIALFFSNFSLTSMHTSEANTQEIFFGEINVLCTFNQLYIYISWCVRRQIQKKIALLNTTHVYQRKIRCQRNSTFFSAFPFYHLQFVTNVMDLQCTHTHEGKHTSCKSTKVIGCTTTEEQIVLRSTYFVLQCHPLANSQDKKSKYKYLFQINSRLTPKYYGLQLNFLSFFC